MGATMLSVDWDAFFPVDPGSQLYDWGHSETMPFLREEVWPLRAAGFIGSSLDLPRCSGWERFWERFSFTRNAVMFYADSHVQALHPFIRMRNPGRILNFDAHHDCGYGSASLQRLRKSGVADCGSWLRAYVEMLGVQAEVVLPAWMDPGAVADVPKLDRLRARIDDGLPCPTKISTVFVARSGAWVPSWCDAEFRSFLAGCPVAHRVDLEEVISGKPMQDRAFDLEQAESIAQTFQAAAIGSAV